MAASTEILGLGELREKFARLKDIDRGARRAVVAAGQVVKREAKSLAQRQGLRLTGALIKNIAIKRERTPAGVVQYHIGVRHGRDLSRKDKQTKYLAVGRSGRIVTRYKDDPFYWRFHEFGTRRTAARPFIGPALENRRSAALEAMGKAIDKEIQKQAASR